MDLFTAVASADLATLREALSAGGDVNVLGPDRSTPLIAAAAAGWAEGVGLLLAAGAEPTWKDAALETAYLKAAANGHPTVMRLLERHAEDDERDLGRAFLAAHGASHGPEYQYEPGRLRQKAAEVAARAADLVGHEDPLRRLERQQRSTRKK
jgi:hypothetical protein